MLLKNKIAVVYGASGSIGGAVAIAFAREGATVFLAGRTLDGLERVAKDIADAGGKSHTAQVDALDEQAVDEYVNAVVDQAGCHNGIEYDVMAAYAEGLNILRSANLGQRDQQAQSGHDAETTPLRDPELYRFEMNLPELAEVWRRGSVIGSWLLDLTAIALLKNAELAGYGGRVSDSGEGRWTIQAAIDEGVPMPVLSAALFERFASRGNADFANRVLSAMRYEFGGHVEKPAP